MYFGHETQKTRAGYDLKKMLPRGLVFIVSEGARQVAKEEKQSVILPSCDVSEEQQWLVQQGVSKGAIVAFLSSQ